MDLIYLPAEIISHILSFLRVTDRLSAGLSCKSWHLVSLQNVFWRNVLININSSANGAFITLKDTSKPIQHITLKDLDINETCQVIDDFFRHVGPKLLSLEIENSYMSENMLQRILLNCPSLESIRLINCRDIFLTGQIQSNGKLNLIEKSLPHLSELCLNDNLSYVTDDSIEQLLQVCTNLKTLNFSGTCISFHSGIYQRYYPRGAENGEPSGFVLTFHRILMHIRKHSTSVKSLNFSRTNLNDKAALALSQVSGLALQSLFLNGSDIGSTGLADICFTQRTLIELDLSACVRITDSALIVLSSSLPHLQFLSLRSCRSVTDEGISSLCQLKGLRHINLQGLNKITSDGIECGILFQSNHLRKINLSATCIQMKTIHQLALCSHQLTYVNFTSCVVVTDDSLRIIWDYLNGLRYLILDWCINVTDAGFVESIDNDINNLKIKVTSTRLLNMTSLIHLSLAGCAKITDLTISSLQLMDLRYLNLANCTSITDAGVLSMSSWNRRSLEILVLRQCPCVTDECVISLPNSLTRLRFLDVQGCKQLSEATLASIERYNVHPNCLKQILSW